MTTELRHSISGYAVVWSEANSKREVFEYGAFDRKMLRKFVDDGGRLLVNHRDNCPIGRVTSLIPDWKGIRMTAELDDSVLARAYWHTISEMLGFEETVGLSVQYFPLKSCERDDGFCEILTVDKLVEISVALGDCRAKRPQCFVTSSKSYYPAPKPTPRVRHRVCTRSGYRPALEQFGTSAEWEAKKRHWPPGMQVKYCGGALIQAK